MSTIFKTIKNDTGEATGQLSLFGKSFANIKRDLSSGQGLVYSLFGNSITSDDAAAINNYANALKSGVGVGKAWDQTMKGTSVVAKQYVLDARRAGKSTTELTQGLNNMTLGAKVSTMAMKALGAAKTMALNIGVTLLISGISKGIDYLIHRNEKMQEALQNSVDEFNTVTDELKSLEEEFKTATARLEELQKLADNGTISATEEAELENLKETNKELARKIALKQQEQAQEARDVLKDSKKNASSTVSSMYERETTGSGNSEYGVAVTPDEELELAIKAYETNSTAADTTDNKNLQGWYEDQAESAKNRIEEMYALISPTIDAYENLINAGIELEGEDKTQYEQLKKSQDAYLAYIYTLNETKEAFVALNAEQQRNVLLNRLTNQGLSQDVANAIVGSISDEDLSKYWNENFSFVPPEMKDGETAEEYGKRYAEAWANGLEQEIENADKMTDSLDRLKGASESIASLQTAFNELSEDGYITTETLSKIKEAVGDNIDNWYEYQQKLLTAKKDSAELNQILSDLTYAIIENEFATKGLENATEEEVAAVLRENGVLNANEVAHGMVTRAKVEAKAEALALAIANNQETDSLYEELKALGLTETAIAELVDAYTVAQNAMTEIANEGVLKRLGLTMDELEAYKTTADFYRNQAGFNEDGSLTDDTENAIDEGGIGGLAGARLVKDANAVASYIDAKNKLDQILNKVAGQTSPEYTTGNSSDQDKHDKSDPTDAIINRTGAPVEALERQGKAIDHQLEMLDAEKEYDKYIELTNKALDNRLKTIEASKTAQAELSKEAQKIRDKYKGVNVDAFFDADGDFTEAYNNYYDSLSEEKRESFASDMQMIQTFKRAWFEYYDGIMSLEKEVFDLRKELQDAHYNHLSGLIDELQRHADLEEKQAEKDKERYDYLIDKEQALLDIKKSKFDLENKLISAQREAEKALATSKIGSEYLDEEARKLIYNDDDYELEIGTIKEIFADVDELTEEYISKLNKLGEEEIYKAEEITAQYERRIAIKEKELEIVQAEVDLQKKQDALNNVLAEKNIRQIVDGKWVWTHDADKLRQATEDLADAKAQVEQLEREQEQLEYTNTLEARIGNWQLEQEAIDVAMEHLQERIDDFSLKLELLKDPLEDFGAIVSELTAELGGVSSYSSSTSKTSSRSASGRLGSVNPNADVGSVVKQMMNNSTMWHVSDSVTKAQLHATNQKLAASIGADYNPANGKYYQNGVPLYDGGGVLKGLGGIKATKEDEIVLPPNITSNILSPEKNALFDKFTDNLGTILGFDKLATQQIPFNIPLPGLNLLDTATNRNTTVNYNMNGDFNVNNPDNSDEIMRKFLQFINQPSQK